jgi:hypothetical protein
MLLSDPADRYRSSRCDRHGVAKDPLGFEDALGVVAQRAVAEVAVMFL